MHMEKKCPNDYQGNIFFLNQARIEGAHGKKAYNSLCRSKERIKPYAMIINWSLISLALPLVISLNHEKCGTK